MDPILCIPLYPSPLVVAFHSDSGPGDATLANGTKQTTQVEAWRGTCVFPFPFSDCHREKTSQTLQPPVDHRCMSQGQLASRLLSHDKWCYFKPLNFLEWFEATEFLVVCYTEIAKWYTRYFYVSEIKLKWSFIKSYGRDIWEVKGAKKPFPWGWHWFSLEGINIVNGLYAYKPQGFFFYCFKWVRSLFLSLSWVPGNWETSPD